MKQVIMIGMVVLVIGIASAGLLEYYGGVEQMVNVEGLVFYIDGANLGGNNYNLTMNQIPDNEEKINITNGDKIVFMTEVLDIERLDLAEFDIYIRVRENNETSYLSLEVLKITPSEEINICGPETLITSSDNFNERLISCVSTEEINFDTEDKIGISISGMAEIRVGYPYTSGYSRMEVSAI